MNILECANAELNGTTHESFVAARNNLCHPSVEGVDISDDEEVWADAAHTVLKTPIECGESAYIYKGYVMLGAKSAEKVYVSTDSLKTASRARATNIYVLNDCPYHIDPDTWLLVGNGETYDLRDVSGLVIVDDALSFVDGAQARCDEATYVEQLKARRKALKFYAEFCVNTILDLGGNPNEVYDIVADDPSFLYSGLTVCHQPYSQESRKDFDELINNMAFIPNVITSAMQLLENDIDQGMARLWVLKGKMIWGVKTHIVNLALSVLGYPSEFERK